MKQLTKEQAIAFAASGEWKDWTHEEIVELQLFQRLLCVDFSRFHEAMEAVLERPVYTHEFADSQSLIEEYQKERTTPTLEEIISKIPKEKLIVIHL